MIATEEDYDYGKMMSRCWWRWLSTLYLYVKKLRCECQNPVVLIMLHIAIRIGVYSNNNIDNYLYWLAITVHVAVADAVVDSLMLLLMRCITICEYQLFSKNDFCLHVEQKYRKKNNKKRNKMRIKYMRYINRKLQLSTTRDGDNSRKY